MDVSSRQDAEIAIVGGGLNGLTAAVALAGAGFDIVLIDRRDPRETLDAGFDGRVSSIAWSSKVMLETIGVWQGVDDAAEPILEIRVSDGDAPLFLHYDHRDVGDHPLGFIAENRILRQALIERLANLNNVQIRAPHEVAGLDREPETATVALADGSRINAPLVIACDGAFSPVRDLAGIRHVRHAYGQTGIVTTVLHERPHRGIAHERFLPAGPFAILPLPGNRSSLVWTEAADIAERILTLDDDGFLEELMWRFGDFLGAVEPVGPRWSYPLTLVHAERYADHRLALVGDSAHLIHPIAGQGYNLGLRDTAALAEVLADRRHLGLEPGHSDGLERYARWRRVDNLMLIAVTDSLNRLFSNDLAPIRLARDVGLAVVNQLPPLKKLFMRHAMGTVGHLPRLLRGEAL
ncbi:MAG: UbiH/UbiF/VisC/COQ6 family ubiquinone biosynthesis hydroxylase [Pseudomonadota bacterium]